MFSSLLRWHYRPHVQDGVAVRRYTGAEGWLRACCAILYEELELFSALGRALKAFLCSSILSLGLGRGEEMSVLSLGLGRGEEMPVLSLGLGRGDEMSVFAILPPQNQSTFQNVEAREPSLHLLFSSVAIFPSCCQPNAPCKNSVSEPAI